MLIRALALAVALGLGTPALADEAEIRARGTDFKNALNTGNVEALAALYTEDAMALPPGAPIVEGRDAIAAMWESTMEAGMRQVELEPVELTVVDDTAYEVGTFDAMVVTEGAEAPARGKFLVVWKQVDGDWLLHRDIWNESPPEE